MTEKRSSSSFRVRSSSHTLSKKPSASKKSDPSLIAAEIIQDVVNRALQEIQERYLRAQSIRFTVHCAHQALAKTLKMHFYQHNEYGRHWGADKRAPPSAPDSWALHQVPMCQNVTFDRELNTVSQIKKEAAEKGIPIVCDTDLDDVSVASEGLIEDMKAVVNESLAKLPESEEEPEEEVSVSSSFSMVVAGAQHYEQYKMKPQTSRLSFGESTIFRLPRVDLPSSGTSRKFMSVSQLSTGEESKLPPIRTDAGYKCRSMSMELKPKKLKGKKSAELR